MMIYLECSENTFTNMFHKFDPLSLLAFLFALTLPIHSTIFAVIFLLTADFVTGIWAAIKTKEKITSKRMSHTVVKILLYNFAILVSLIVETYLVPEIPLIRICTGFIALTEIHSFYENIRKITGLDLWKAVKTWIHNKKEDVKDLSK